MAFEVISSSFLPIFSSLMGLMVLGPVGAAAVVAVSPDGATLSVGAIAAGSVVVGSVVAAALCWTGSCTSDMVSAGGVLD